MITSTCWTVVPLGDIVENKDSKRVPIKEAERTERHGSYPYYGASGIIDYVDGYLFEGSHLLVGEDGANLLARSTPIAFIADGRFWVNNHAHVLKATERIELKYLAYFFETLDLKPYVTGSAQPKLTRKSLDRIPVPLPPLEEQRRIAAILDKADAVRRKRKEAIALTEELLRSAFLEMFGDPITNPKGWEVKNFGSLITNRDSRRIPLKQADRAKRQGAYPYYGASGVIDSIDDYLFEGEHLLIAEDGANLLARSTPIAFRANGRFWVNNHAHIVEDKGCADLCFLELFFSLIDIEQWVTGSAQPKLNWGNLAQIPVPTPPKQLQKQFRTLSQKVSEVHNRMGIGSDRHEYLFNSLLQRAFRGEL